MKNKIVGVFLFFTSLSAQDLQLKETHFIFEDDVDFVRDYDYTFGSEIGFLFSFPYLQSETDTYYISFSYDWQMYTPKDFRANELIEDDRPYAGYQYIKSSLLKTNNTRLHTLSIQLGIIGPSAKMEQIQNGFHDIIDSPPVNGWDNQLKDEMIFQLNYSYRKFYKLNKNSVLLPDFGFELGNASIKGYGMLMYRFGNDVQNDFGTSLIDNTLYYKVPRPFQNKKKWRYNLQLSLKANIVARNIFLDGNSFKDSHKVEKNIFVGEASYGVNLGYKKWTFSYLRKHLTKEFIQQISSPNYGSLIFSYQY